MVARGEVWWYEHPDAKRRPYLILTRSEAIPVLNQIVGVPATAVVRNIPTEVPLSKADGMPRSCVLSLDNITVIRKALCTKRITRLTGAKLAAVCEALSASAAC